MILKRKINSALERWFNSKKETALLVMGARQVGKTTSIRDFGKKHYSSIIEMNFEEKPSLKAIFDGDLDAITIYEKLSVAGIGVIKPHKTLLFFDEIQSCPQSRTAIKFLVQDGRCDVIASGSLLGINYKEVSSYPVGFEQKLEMTSMDFEEFLWANGISEENIHKLHVHFKKKKPVDTYIHSKMMDLFKRYMIVGGMPAVVSTYIDTHDIAKVIEQQKIIIGSYRDDIAKYAGNKKTRAKAVFDSIPMQLTEKNKKFKLVKVKTGAKNRSYEDAVMWLFDAGIACYCFNITELEIPLELCEKRSIYKFFMCDTGLLSCMSLGNVQKAILDGDLCINGGAITENAVGDLLRKNTHSLHYYDRKGRLEVDFIINRNQTVLPVEVKSGADYMKHPSLTKILMEQNNTITSAIVLCRENIQEIGEITYYPLYMVMFL